VVAAVLIRRREALAEMAGAAPTDEKDSKHAKGQARVDLPLSPAVAQRIPDAPPRFYLMIKEFALAAGCRGPPRSSPHALRPCLCHPFCWPTGRSTGDTGPAGPHADVARPKNYTPRARARLSELVLKITPLAKAGAAAVPAANLDGQ